MNVTLLDILHRDLAKTDQRAKALGFLADVLADVEVDGIPGDGSYTYDTNRGAAERYMLAGGGPSAWAVFVSFGDDDVTGYLEYADSDGTTLVPIPTIPTIELRKALRRDARAREARS